MIIVVGVEVIQCIYADFKGSIWLYGLPAIFC